jgi:hypothetical protein
MSAVIFLSFLGDWSLDLFAGFQSATYLLALEDNDPQLWHLSNSKRLREASSSIREYLESRYLKYLNVERTGKMYGTIADKSDDDAISVDGT